MSTMAILSYVYSPLTFSGGSRNFERGVHGRGNFLRSRLLPVARNALHGPARLENKYEKLISMEVTCQALN